MIRIRTDLIALPQDDPAEAAAAFAAGWRIDDDLWWVRPVRGGEPELYDDGDRAFIVRRFAFAGGAEGALRLDRTMRERAA